MKVLVFGNSGAGKSMCARAFAVREGLPHLDLAMSELLMGKVQAGFGDASRWLKLFNVAYSEKLGIPVFQAR
jgi:AAA+ superfamily predicted ATPase